MGTPEELGEALKEIRKRRGLQQSEMARRAGITKAMACCYERGRRYPSLATLDALLVALRVDLGVLDRALRFVKHRRARKRGAGTAGRGQAAPGRAVQRQAVRRSAARAGRCAVASPAPGVSNPERRTP